MEQNNELPYIDLAEFNAKVEVFAKTNWILGSLFANPKSGIETWEDLPPDLIQDLFNKLGCKPSMQKY